MTILTPAASFLPTAKALVALCLVGLLAVPASYAEQVCGDVNGDDKVTTSDAQATLKAAVGQDVALTCTDGCAALEVRVAELEALVANLSIAGNNMVLTGMNFQVVSGSGTTTGTINGTGNIIVGYNETNSSNDKRTGSHNIVVGRYHSFSKFGGLIAGEDNSISGESASVLGGAENSASGNGSLVVGGFRNQSEAVTSVAVAGESNRAQGRSCLVTGGASNRCTGIASAVNGGTNNLCTGTASAVGGGSNVLLNSNFAWKAGTLGPTY